jgi:hypothetical protein
MLEIKPSPDSYHNKTLPLERLASLIKEVKEMHKSEIFDPQGLTQRCIDIFPEASKVIFSSIGEAQLHAVLQLKQMVTEGQISQEEAITRNEMITRNDLSNHEIEFIAHFAVWEYDSKLFMGIAKIVLLVGAFLVSLLIEPIIRENILHFPASSPDSSDKFIGATLVFVIQLMLFGGRTKQLETWISWKIFARVKSKLLIALGRLDEIYQSKISCCEDVLRKE